MAYKLDHWADDRRVEQEERHCHWAGYPIIRGALADGNHDGAVGDAGNGTGIFSVSNGSILRLNELVLEGGNAEYGGAVGLLSSSSLFVSSCTFANNSASQGGETRGLRY